MATTKPANVSELLLLRSGLVFVESDAAVKSAISDSHLRGFDLELAQLGYVASKRLREQFAGSTAAQLSKMLVMISTASQNAKGGDRKLTPMFRRFPDDVPSDTLALWWDRVVVRYLQQPQQPCVLCGKVATIHVLNPCMDLVCEHCFDGSNYSGCPICNRTVDPSSPFFRTAPAKEPTKVSSETFTLLDLGNISQGQSTRTKQDACRELFAKLCQRTQAMSPVDVDTLLLIVQTYSDEVSDWLPPTIPVRENIAIIFGELLKAAVGSREPQLLASTLRRAQLYLTNATDVLRLITTYSGGSPALLATEKWQAVAKDGSSSRRFVLKANPMQKHFALAKVSHHRFAVAKMPRSMRRSLLAILDSLPSAAMFDDMTRHASRWIWVAEFLHPGEYASRYRNVAVVFAQLRGNPPASVPVTDGAPRQTWSSQLEQAMRARQTDRVLQLLSQRPGDFLRRFDHTWRTANDSTRVANALISCLPNTATPALLSLRSHIAQRGAPLPARVYWPKVNFFVPNPPTDIRPAMPGAEVMKLTASIDAELVRRFAEKPPFAHAIIDDDLAHILVPFNERTAAKSAVQLSRGSQLALPGDKQLRFFIHWCEPQNDHGSTDIDLSVGFYDDNWQPVGVCSYYQLTAKGSDGATLATSSGDFTSAPWPDGAAEFVDIDRDRARSNGYRYAVMIVNAYSGLPFRHLERATAGVMLRDSLDGQTFDPRTVNLAFALDGDNGVYMPLVVDLKTGTLHWLDCYALGQIEHNNVATSNRSVGHIVPAMLGYFASGTRPNMRELALLHAAARASKVTLRADQTADPQLARTFHRADGESAVHFLDRIRNNAGAVVANEPPHLEQPTFIAGINGSSLELCEGSMVYAVFRQRVTASVGAADLLT
jgi:hypothetical protein